jgi:hypothetical protein
MTTVPPGLYCLFCHDERHLWTDDPVVRERERRRFVDMLIDPAVLAAIRGVAINPRPMRSNGDQLVQPPARPAPQPQLASPTDRKPNTSWKLNEIGIFDPSLSDTAP